MQWPITIRSDRVTLRAPCDGDRDAVVRLMTDPITREYLGGSVDYASRQALELSPLGLTWGRWAIASSEDDDHLLELELSYALLPEHTGKGLAAESCRLLLEWARDALEDDHVIAVTQRRNKRSVALLQRLGFSVRRGLEEFGAQQLMMERSFADPLPSQEELAQWRPPHPPPYPHA
jgi:RimJ/RimL family protein N-acetyltransferase